MADPLQLLTHPIQLSKHFYTIFPSTKRTCIREKPLALLFFFSLLLPLSPSVCAIVWLTQTNLNQCDWHHIANFFKTPFKKLMYYSLFSEWNSFSLFFAISFLGILKLMYAFFLFIVILYCVCVCFFCVILLLIPEGIRALTKFTVINSCT